MKKRCIIIINILIVGLILFIIVKYANDRATESNLASIASFEKMTTTTEQIVVNYLEDEQHLCDIWANYINRSAEAGTPKILEQRGIPCLALSMTSLIFPKSRQEKWKSSMWTTILLPY